MIEVKLAPIDINGRIFQGQIGIIEKTELGIEDHSFLTFVLHLGFGTSGQGAGTYMLDYWDKETDKNSPLLWTGAVIRNILEVVGVRNWEDLRGKKIIALRDKEYDLIRGIMSAPPSESKYVIFEDLFEEYKNG